ncbi:hypothetical protein Tco_1250497 [Tanacetum coccineum]
MANLSEDIQSAGSDTCPPILDRETLAEGAKGALHLGPERDRVVDNVKMLLEGSELTKDDRESQLYDEFEHFRQNKGDTIHEYYVRLDRTEVRGIMLGEQLQLEMGEFRTEVAM